jgi:hypothetical protein
MLPQQIRLLGVEDFAEFAEGGQFDLSAGLGGMASRSVAMVNAGTRRT